MRAQTATEYLILLVIVMIIVIIGAVLLFDVAPIGGGSGQKPTDRADLRSKDIGTTDFAIGSTSSTFKLQNNKQELLQITAVTVNGTNCDSSLLPLTIGQGVERTLTCTNINTSDLQYALNYSITWSKPGVGVSFTEELPLLVGDAVVQ